MNAGESLPPMFPVIFKDESISAYSGPVPALPIGIDTNEGYGGCNGIGDEFSCLTGTSLGC